MCESLDMIVFFSFILKQILYNCMELDSLDSNLTILS